MRQFNISLTETDSLNITALDNLNPSWVSVSDPQLSINIIRSKGARKIVNSDFVAESHFTISHHVQSHDHWVVPFSSSTGGCDFTRLKKSYQQAWLKDQIRDSSFLPVPTWSDPDSAVLQENTSYLIKPEHGARGIGNILFNSDYATPTKLLKLLNSAKSSEPSEQESDYKIIQDKFVKSLFNTDLGIPIAHYVSVRDLHPGEGIEVLTSTEANCLQEQIQSIYAEYRFITDENGKVCYIVRRSINTVLQIRPGVSYGQGCGNMEIPKSVFIPNADGVDNLFKVEYAYTESSKVPTKLQDTRHRDCLTSALLGIESLKLPLHSFDVFIQEDANVNTAWNWGIFEFCPQFGVEAVPMRMIIEPAKRFVEQCVNAGK